MTYTTPLHTRLTVATHYGWDLLTLLLASLYMMLMSRTSCHLAYTNMTVSFYTALNSP